MASSSKRRRLMMSPASIESWRMGWMLFTRRVIKWQPGPHLGYMYGVAGPGTARIVGSDYPDAESDDSRCPYGKPGDVLAIIEGHRFQLSADGVVCRYRPRNAQQFDETFMRIDLVPPDVLARLRSAKRPGAWRPARALPVCFVREFAKLVELRVEQLSKITDSDAIEEGVVVPSASHMHAVSRQLDPDTVRYWLLDTIRLAEGIGVAMAQTAIDQHRKHPHEPLWTPKLPKGGYGDSWYTTPRDAFLAAWDGLNARRGHGTDTDPWLWVLGLERVDKDGEAIKAAIAAEDIKEARDGGK